MKVPYRTGTGKKSRKNVIKSKDSLTIENNFPFDDQVLVNPHCYIPYTRIFFRKKIKLLIKNMIPESRSRTTVLWWPGRRAVQKWWPFRSRSPGPSPPSPEHARNYLKIRSSKYLLCLPQHLNRCSGSGAVSFRPPPSGIICPDSDPLIRKQENKKNLYYCRFMTS